MKLRVRRTSPRAVIPRYAHPGDSGLDLHACLDRHPLYLPASEPAIAAE